MTQGQSGKMDGQVRWAQRIPTNEALCACDTRRLDAGRQMHTRDAETQIFIHTMQTRGYAYNTHTTISPHSETHMYTCRVHACCMRACSIHACRRVETILSRGTWVIASNTSAPGGRFLVSSGSCPSSGYPPILRLLTSYSCSVYSSISPDFTFSSWLTHQRCWAIEVFRMTRSSSMVAGCV